jgi:hypothetical protein
MTKFKEGDIAFTASFNICKNELIKMYPATLEVQLSAVHVSKESYNINDLYKDKNEVIDALIKKLEDMIK